MTESDPKLYPNHFTMTFSQSVSKLNMRWILNSKQIWKTDKIIMSERCILVSRLGHYYTVTVLADPRRFWAGTQTLILVKAGRNYQGNKKS